MASTSFTAKVKKTENRGQVTRSKGSSNLSPIFSIFFLFLLARPVLGIAGEAQVPVAKIVEIEGSLELTRGGQNSGSSAGQSLYPGDRLRTGAGQRALLEFSPDQTLVKLAERTLVRIPAEGADPLYLEEGLIWGKKTAGGSPFQIGTPILVTAVRGTEFFIRVIGPEQALVLVKEGTVEVDFGEERVPIGAKSVGFFQKGMGSRVSPVGDPVIKDWEANFQTEEETL